MERGKMRQELACLSIVVLALGLGMTAPAFAEENGKLPVDQVQAAPGTAFDLAEPANMTPAEPEDGKTQDQEVGGQEIGDLEIQVDPSRGLQVKRIRACEPEEELQCPPGCGCVVISNAVRCLC